MHESNYTAAVNRLLPKEIYSWKINARFSSGVPDSYYSANKGDLWVEYKIIRTNPKLIKPKLRPLQAQWLRKRYEEGRNVAVIVETPKGAAVFTRLTWEEAHPATHVTFHTRKGVAAWITSQCLEEVDAAED